MFLILNDRTTLFAMDVQKCWVGPWNTGKIDFESWKQSAIEYGNR